MQSIKVIKPLKDKADEHLLARLKNGDESVLTFIYKEYCRAFVKWSGQQFSSDDEVAKDAFQEAVIALHSNVVKGKLTELTSTLKTYLFSIGRNLVLKKLNYDSRFTGTETLATHSDSTSERMELNERQQLSLIHI